MASKPTLSTPIQVGKYLLKNRLVLAPLTRLRNSDKGVPPSYAADYYSQRATGACSVSWCMLTGRWRSACFGGHDCC